VFIFNHAKNCLAKGLTSLSFFQINFCRFLQTQIEKATLMVLGKQSAE